MLGQYNILLSQYAAKIAAYCSVYLKLQSNVSCPNNAFVILVLRNNCLLCVRGYEKVVVYIYFLPLVSQTFTV